MCSPSDFSLTDEEIQKLKDGNFTAAFCYHLQEDQSNMTKLASAQAQLEEWGIKTVATTTANMVVEQQIADIESVLALKPDVVFVMPIDADALSSTCKKVSEAGSKLVFMEMYANGLTEGTDYVGTAAKTAGRTDLVCATPDLNDSTARRIAEGDMIVGSAAPRSYEAGQTEAYMAAYALLGKELPSTYCAVPGQFVMVENLLDAYQNMYHTEAPKEIVNILNAK